MADFRSASALVSEADSAIAVVLTNDIEDNDIVLLEVVSKDTTLPANDINLPAGFTEPANARATAGSNRAAVFWRRVTTADRGAVVAVTRGGSGTNPLSAMAYVISGAKVSGDPFGTEGIQIATKSTDNGALDLPAIDPTAAARVFYLWAFGNDTPGLNLPTSFDNGTVTFALEVRDSSTVGSDISMGLYSADHDGTALAADQISAASGAAAATAFAFTLLTATVEEAAAMEPTATDAAGNWTITGGAASHHVALTDENASTGIQSPANPVDESIEFTLSDIGPPSSGALVFEIDAAQV